MIEFDKLNDRVQKIQEDLDNVRKEVLSKEKMEKKFEEIRERAQKAKEELEEQVSTLKDKSKEKAQALLDSLNEIINFKLSIGVDDAPNSPIDGNSADGGGFFNRAKSWIGNQRLDIWDKTKWQDERGKNILRTAGFAATGVGLFALAYKGVKSIFGKEAREERRKRRDEKRAEKQRKREEEKAKKEKEREERRKEIEELPFWDRPIGKFLKWTGIGTLVVGGVYALKRKIEKGKEDSPESKMKVLYGLEDKCKGLKEGANQCLESSHTYVVDYVKNKEEYDDILAKAKTIKNDSKTIFDEIKASNASDKVKKQAERIESNINKYVEEIEAIKDEIYATLPDGVDVGNGGNWGGSSDSGSGTPSEGEGTPSEGEGSAEKLEPVSATVVTESAIDYLGKFKNEIPRPLHGQWDRTIKKGEDILNNYFKLHPILKESPSKKIVFKIDDAASFGSMIKDIYNALPSVAYPFIPSNIKNSLKDISNTLKDVDAKTYEDIVFQHFGEIIKGAVKKEGGTMTVQEYYDSICKTYPNKNASKIASDLAKSGQANKDIKDMSYPFA